MPPGPASLALRALDEAAPALGARAAEMLRRALASPAPDLVQSGVHGTVVCRLPTDEGPRRALEVDRDGTLLTVLRWDGGRLEAAWVRLPDRSWIRLEPRATREAPWGLSDRLWHATAAGDTGRPLTVCEAVRWEAVDRIPVLAEPGRLPPGAGGAVLNLLATLAADQGRPALRYAGPYPTETLFLTLLEAFRYEGDPADPLAAFMSGDLAWRPAPHERWFAPHGACVNLRGRVEKVVWGGRAYVRPDWQGVARHAPWRLRDADGAVYGSLWALGTVVEDRLMLSPPGDRLSVFPPRPQPSQRASLPPAVVAGVGAVVAATSAPALAPSVPAALAGLRLSWAPTPGDLVAAAGDEIHLSTALRALIAERLAAASGQTQAAVALA
ncbi:MAG TPA: hypothetical protein VNO23_09590, partial [Candidatus Binatia bacterium]|nr:hypothetical protein [Candidatus Binatia bacterium]